MTSEKCTKKIMIMTSQTPQHLRNRTGPQKEHWLIRVRVSVSTDQLQRFSIIPLVIRLAFWKTGKLVVVLKDITSYWIVNRFEPQQEISNNVVCTTSKVSDQPAHMPSFKGYHFLLNCKQIWAATWDFQQCGMCDQQSLRPACAYAQSDQSLC